MNTFAIFLFAVNIFTVPHVLLLSWSNKRPDKVSRENKSISVVAFDSKAQE